MPELEAGQSSSCLVSLVAVQGLVWFSLGSSCPVLVHRSVVRFEESVRDSRLGQGMILMACCRAGAKVDTKKRRKRKILQGGVVCPRGFDRRRAVGVAAIVASVGWWGQVVGANGWLFRGQAAIPC